MRKLLILSMLYYNISVGGAGAAGPFTAVPNTFTDGTPCGAGCAANVMANYNHIRTEGNAWEADLLSQIAAITGSSLPAGAVLAFPSGSCPPGWLPADGTAGTVDVRGAYIRGLDLGAGRDPARTLASFQADQFQDHTHTSAFVSGFSFGLDLGGASPAVQSGGTSALPVTSTMATGNAATETRPDSVVLNYCYKS